MTGGEELLRGVLEAPHDDAPHLVYADWLEENGERERAEFIRVQCELSRLGNCRCGGTGRQHLGHPATVNDCSACGALRKRERELSSVRLSLWREWCRPLVDIPEARWEFRRGFVEQIELPCADFLRHAEALFRCQPVTEVVLTDVIFSREYGGGDDRWAVYRRHVGPLWDILCPHSHGEDVYVERRDRVEMQDTLSAACVIFGRGLAGLSSLKEVKHVRT